MALKRIVQPGTKRHQNRGYNWLEIGKEEIGDCVASDASGTEI
jgi:hypothetical protein